MNKSKNKLNDWSSRTRQKTVILAIWTCAWVLSVAAATFGPEFFWGENTVVNVLMILLNLGIGIGMIITNIQHLQTLDEMMQKVQLEAMGISLGVAVVGGIGYSMLDATNVIPYDAEIGGLVMLIGITYLISVYINVRKYK